MRSFIVNVNCMYICWMRFRDLRYVAIPPTTYMTLEQNIKRTTKFRVNNVLHLPFFLIDISAEINVYACFVIQFNLPDQMRLNSLNLDIGAKKHEQTKNTEGRCRKK